MSHVLLSSEFCAVHARDGVDQLMHVFERNVVPAADLRHLPQRIHVGLGKDNLTIVQQWLAATTVPG